MESILLGSVFFVAGLILFIFPPRKINNIYGYRTRSSKRNIESWITANKLASLLLMLFGAVIFIIAYLTMSNLVTIITMIIFGLVIFIIVEFRI